MPPRCQKSPLPCLACLSGRHTAILSKRCKLGSQNRVGLTYDITKLKSQIPVNSVNIVMRRKHETDGLFSKRQLSFLCLFLIIEKNLTVSTKMPRKYGTSTLKYLKKIWGGGSPLPAVGRGTPRPHTPPSRRLRRLASSRAPSALYLPPNYNTWIRL